jgi:hypothetical protein
MTSATVKVWYSFGQDGRRRKLESLAQSTGVKLLLTSVSRGWFTTTIKYEVSGDAEQMGAFQARLAEIV